LIAGGCLVLKSVSETFWRSCRGEMDGIHVPPNGDVDVY
jgi:hypothetical protein